MGTQRDLERYAGLFARRTRGMTSSAMRDLMAITERPDVISLAGGQPDTSSFPSELLAGLMSGVAAEASAKALQYSPTEGVWAVREAIVEVMAAEGTQVDAEEVLVTTGGQQVIDLVCKTLIDPGDVVVAEAPTYPGAVPTFTAYQADVVQVGMDGDGMLVDELEATLDRLEAEGRRPKFIYTIPTFQNPGGVTMSLPRRRRIVQVAAERELLVLEDNPYGLLRYEGDPLPTLRSLDGGRFVIYLGTFSKILSPGIRIGWAVAPGPVQEKMNTGKQGVDLCSPAFSQSFIAAYFARAEWREYVDALRALYRRRRDVMLEALAESFGPEATWTRPEGGMFVWATLPDYIDTTDLLARALRANVAFVPGRAAYLDGRGGSEMRLNFSGSTEDKLREGVRRIGTVIAEQVGLYGTLTGASPARRSPTCCRCRPAARARTARPTAPVPRVAVLKGGRSFERQVSLRSGARVEAALERLGHDVVGIDVGGDLVPRLREAAPDVAFLALHGPDGEDGTVQELLEVLGIRYTGSRVSACVRSADKVLAKHELRDAGVPTPDWVAFTQTAFRELGAGEALPAIEERLAFPIVVKPAGQGSALGVKVAHDAGEVPGALVAAFSYDAKVLLERHVAGHDLAVSVVDGRALPVVEAIPNDEAEYDFEHRYEIGATEFRCPAELPGDAARRAQDLALRTWEVLGLSGVARVDLMLDARSGELWVLEANTIPGMTETSLLPMAADAAGIGFDALIAEVLALA
jgi:2-aminoadipate transaminase